MIVLASTNRRKRHSMRVASVLTENRIGVVANTVTLRGMCKSLNWDLRSRVAALGELVISSAYVLPEQRRPGARRRAEERG